MMSPSQGILIFILTNQKSMYKFSNAFETGLPDHHKVISTISNQVASNGHP